ncbi:MAG: ATP-dependent Clp protease proteolytic subunit, partial [Alphaproteobacteria bacterium]|nr:ATP-dependent Clp protease proteolytic subunit [Alphaproteobacteria bacterium]
RSSDLRILLLGTGVDDEIANVLVAQMLYLGNQDADTDMTMYINSPGGVVSSGLAMYDTMQYIRPEVATVCIGQAASMGSLLLTAGASGKRYCLPNAKVMIHQPSGGYQGQATDIEIHAKEVMRTKARLNEIYVTHTGQKLGVIEAAMERDNFMTGDEAKTFGLIDEVVEKRPVDEDENGETTDA